MRIGPRGLFLLSALLIIAAVWYVFGETLGGGFFMEDYYFLKEIRASGGLDRTLQDLHGNWLGFTGYPYYRPLVTASLALDHALFGLEPWGYHLTHVLLHALNALLVMVLVQRLYPGGGVPAGLAAALLFATHPVHPNAVGWVAARSDLLVGLGTLCMLAAYHRAWVCRRPAPLILGVTAFAAALLSKESGIMALVMTLLLPVKVGWRRRLLTTLPCMILLAAYGIARLAFLEEGLNLHESAVPAVGARGAVARATGLFCEQLMIVVNSISTPGPLLVMAGLAVIGLFRRGGISLLVLAVAFPVFGLLPILPILGNVDSSFFFNFSRYWYLAVIGPILLVGLSVGRAGRWGWIPLGAVLVLAVMQGRESREIFDKYRKRPAEIASGVAEFLESEGGTDEHQRVNVLLRAHRDLYGNVHVIPLAFTAAATQPFRSRDIPLYPLENSAENIEELWRLIRLHGGHREFFIFTLEPGTGKPVAVKRFPRVSRWTLTTRDGPYRLGQGLWKDIDCAGRSPLSFDVIRLEGVTGEGNLRVLVETDRGVFQRDCLVMGKDLDTTFVFREDDEFVQARSISRIRLEPASTQDNPLEGVISVERIVVTDLDTVRFLEAPGHRSGIRVQPAPPVFRWKSSTPRELGVRFLTAFGFDPPAGSHPYRPRDLRKIRDLQKKMVVGANMGAGWFWIFTTMPEAMERKRPLGALLRADLGM